METKKLEKQRIKYQKPTVLASSIGHKPLSDFCKGGIANCLHCREM